jgi:hypothetical protein
VTNQNWYPSGDQHSPLGRIELEIMSDFRPHARAGPPALVLGYAQMPEPAIRAGVHALARAVQAARGRV